MAKYLKDENGLSPMDLQFIDEFVIDFNATQAAIRVGHPKRAAANVGCFLLRRHDVRELVKKRINERAERTRVTADRVVYELALIAFSDIRNYEVTSTGALTLKDAVMEDAARAVSSVKQQYKFGDEGEVVGGMTEIRLWPKAAALEMLGRHLAMFIDRREHTGKDGGPIETKNVLTADMAEQIKRKIFGLGEDPEDESK